MIKKYLLPSRSPVFWVLFVLTCLLSMILAKFTVTDHFKSHLFTLGLETDRAVKLNLFYDYGSGYNEFFMQEREVSIVGKEVVLDFSIPAWERLKSLRIDTNQGEIAIKLKSATLKYHGHETYLIPMQSIMSSGGANISYTESDSAEILVGSEAEDPMILINDIGVLPGTSLTDLLLHYFKWLFGAVILMLVGQSAFRFFFLAK